MVDDPRAPRGRSSKVAIVHLAKQAEEFAKGVGWFPRRYEPRFDEVVVACLYGADDPVSKAKTRYVSLGGRSWRIDLLLSPLRLWRLLRAERPDAIVGYDPTFLWWATLLTRVPVLLVSMCLPDEIYEQTGKTVSGVPHAVERRLVGLTFASSAAVLVPENADGWQRWVEGYRSGRRRLRVIRPSIVEGFVGLEFYERLAELRASGTVARASGSLLYVGRLHPQKYPLDLVEALARAAAVAPNVHLTIVGSGPARDDIVRLADDLGVADRITIRDRVDNTELAELYLRTEVFVSPFTAMSAREAALAGCAIAGYEAPSAEFLSGLALLVSVRDTDALGAAVGDLLTDPALWRRVSDACRSASERLWGRPGLEASLAATFDFLRRP